MNGEYLERKGKNAIVGDEYVEVSVVREDSESTILVTNIKTATNERHVLFSFVIQHEISVSIEQMNEDLHKAHLTRFKDVIEAAIQRSQLPRDRRKDLLFYKVKENS